MKRFIEFAKRQLPTTGKSWWYLSIYLTAVGWCIVSGVSDTTAFTFFLGLAILVIVGLLVHRWPNWSSHVEEGGGEESGWRFDVTADVVGGERPNPRR